MRTMKLSTFNALPKEWRMIRGNRCYVMLAGRFRPVVILTPLGPMELEPA